jgi:hypothetical protein
MLSRSNYCLAASAPRHVQLAATHVGVEWRKLGLKHSMLSRHPQKGVCQLQLNSAKMSEITH